MRVFLLVLVGCSCTVFVAKLAWHPREPGRAYEAGGGGSAWSDDAGESWRPADDGRDRNYTWSVAPDPADPDVWFLSASTGPFAAHGRRDAQARIYRREGDSPWEEVAHPGRAMPYALSFGPDGRLFAALSDGRILQGGEWQALELRRDRISELHALVPAP